MRDFQQRKKIKKWLYSRTTLVLLALFTVFSVRNAVGIFKKEDESRKNVEEVSLKLEEAKERHKELTDDMATIQTTAGIEREIRERYSVSKDGEEVVVIVDHQSLENEESSSDKGFLSSLKAWFRDIF